jgi:hypothetical protein
MNSDLTRLTASALPLVACDRDKPREGRVWGPHRLFGLESGLFLRLDVLAIVDLALLPASPTPWSGTWSRPNSESIPTVFGESSEWQARLLQSWRLSRTDFGRS